MSGRPNFKSYITENLLSAEQENKKPSPPVRPKKPAPPPPRFSDKRQKVPSGDNSILNALKKELADLKTSTMSRSEYEAIQTDLLIVREDVGRTSSQFNNKLLSLMKEVDEEKKSTHEMDAEIHRIKKLILSDDN